LFNYVGEIIFISKFELRALIAAMPTREDIDQIIALGYIVDISVDEFITLLNEYFSGLDLLVLLKQVGELFDDHATKPIYKRLTYVATPNPNFQIVYRSADHTNPNSGLSLVREFLFVDDLLIARHKYFSIPANVRNRGLGKKLLALFLDQYLAIGVKQIHLMTGLKDGGVVWAKMGFNALYKHEMQDILNEAKQILPGLPEIGIVTAIFDRYYNKEPNGKSFPIRRWADIEKMEQILKHYAWHGWIDLTNKEELRNFKQNVSR
jgi:hypothetical protein